MLYQMIDDLSLDSNASGAEVPDSADPLAVKQLQEHESNNEAEEREVEVEVSSEESQSELNSISGVHEEDDAVSLQEEPNIVELPHPPTEDGDIIVAPDRSDSQSTKTSIDDEPEKIYKRKQVVEELEEAEDDVGLKDSSPIQVETKDILGVENGDVFVETAEPLQRRAVAPLKYKHRVFEFKEITSFGNTQEYANGYKPNAAKSTVERSTPGGGKKKGFLSNIRKINGKLEKIQDNKE